MYLLRAIIFTSDFFIDYVERCILYVCLWIKIQLHLREIVIFGCQFEEKRANKLLECFEKFPRSTIYSQSFFLYHNWLFILKHTHTYTHKIYFNITKLIRYVIYILPLNVHQIFEVSFFWHVCLCVCVWYGGHSNIQAFIMIIFRKKNPYILLQQNSCE